MLQAFFPDATYNTAVPWPFASLAELWGGKGLEARTATPASRRAGDGVAQRLLYSR